MNKDTTRNHFPEETAQELYDNAPCGYVSFLKSGLIFNINDTLLTWLGYEKKEVVGEMKIQDLFKIGGKIYFETHFFPLLRMQGYVNEIYFDLEKKDKSIIPALINVKIGREGSPEEQTYRATILDISDRRNYEQELIRARHKAEEMTRAKAEMLAVISHEVRTPLNAIHGIANLLKNTSLRAQQRRYAEVLLLSSENLLKLVNNLLDLSKIEANKLKAEEKAFRLSNIINTLYHTFKPKCREKKVLLQTQIAREVPDELIGDPLKINQVLTNLLGNAIKFTSSGQIKLGVKLKEKKGDNYLLTFNVKDTGIGIPKDKIESIFEEFTQASYEVNMNYGGSGLGLSISQKLLHIMGSEMRVKSIENKGSEFSFDLHLKKNDETLGENEVQELLDEHLKLLKSARILIVEDSEINTFIFSEYFKTWKVAFDFVPNGEEAIKAIKEKQYDVILMDLQMPGLSGYKTAEMIRQLEIKKQPAIIAISASSYGDVRQKLEESGINDYVPKPFGPEDLINSLIRQIQAFSASSTTCSDKDELKMEEIKIPETPNLDKGADLSRFLKMANYQREPFEKFINSTLKAFRSYKREFLEASEENNIKCLRELNHQSTMSIYYIQANKLKSLLNEYISCLEEKDTGPRPDRLKAEIVKEFDQIITHLQDAEIGDYLEV